MKEFATIAFDPSACKQGLAALGALLAAKPELSERQHVQL